MEGKKKEERKSVRIQSFTWPIYLQPADRWRHWMLRELKWFYFCVLWNSIKPVVRKKKKPTAHTGLPCVDRPRKKWCNIFSETTGSLKKAIAFRSPFMQKETLSTWTLLSFISLVFSELISTLLISKIFTHSFIDLPVAFTDLCYLSSFPI